MSLEKLEMDYVDLFLVHRPSADNGYGGDANGDGASS